MNIKSYLFTLIVSSFFLIATGMTPPVYGEANTTTKVPLSFYGLGNNQSIWFLVSTPKPPACFALDVSTQPRPQARIELLMNSSLQIVTAEKIWGHPAGEQVTRPLTPADLQTLENFLTAHRARGAVPPPGYSGRQAMEFDLITKRMAKEGFMRADIDKKEFYTPSEEAERDFIKNFIGFSESGSK